MDFGQRVVISVPLQKITWVQQEVSVKTQIGNQDNER